MNISQFGITTLDNKKYNKGVFHAWVIVDLARGIYACAKLKKLPAEETAEAEFCVVAENCDVGEGGGKPA